ncbi:MAG: class I SAM-dependent methyltransferase [Gammaproteobacteria bacterium]|nr:class I SAM-dependent methyltransferase [Gammaproteobacteria bacterium]MYH34438.1 class I SAM-dependent methyltransferase [Gammaproteobacteria bacterium]MYL01518.1 class I SAM-dependent methyltransferase [Gammaproteobacteria bacterium]
MLAMALVAAFSGSAALADGHDGDSTDARLRAAITGEHRSAEKRARDAYRNPYETLTFLGLAEDMTVLEINATGGWYTEIIAPVVAGTGKYFATMWGPDTSEWAKGAYNELEELIDADRALYGDAEVVAISGDNFRPIEPGSADLVLTFRNIHNWMTSGSIHDMLEMMYVSAKPGGHLGIVEHRGNPLIRQDPKAESGYVNEGYTIRLAEEAGWQLVATSDINNNPMDDKDYEKRVWRLPPTLRYLALEGWPEVDEAQRIRSLAIGESDRFTLLFVKPTG